jgi:hypothetical protein
MKRGMYHAGIVLVLLVAGCTGYDATPPPAARLSFSLDLPAGAKAQVRVYDGAGNQVGSTEVVGNAAAEVRLTSDRDFDSLRLVATAGQRVLKGLALEAAKSETAALGKLDARTTATVQLIQQKVAGQGGTFAAVPPDAIADLRQQIVKGGTEIKAFTDLVIQLVGQTTTKQAAAMFNALDADLVGALAKSHGADYLNKRTAAVARLTVSLVCDAALIKVMFTVDASGRALDGNGSPQLIRQPTKSGLVYLAITVDDSSSVPDSAGLIKSTMAPNDPETVMFDDGTNSDEVASDGVFTRVVVLPRGMRVKYKYTNGSANEGWTRTEEWPGNARILEVRDLLSRYTDGTPDCLVIRRDVFGDEASNKNFVNLHSKIKAGGGTLSFEQDLGGAAAAKVAGGRYTGGLQLGDVQKLPPLSPAGLAEAAENGACTVCPAPLTLDTDDRVRPRLVSAEFSSTSRVKVSFSEALEYASASSPTSYLILDGGGRALAITAVAASGPVVTLQIEPPDFAQRYTLHVKGLKDASANANPLGGPTQLELGADRTSPQILSVLPLPITDFNAGAKPTDPTLGQVLKITFDEELDQASAENIGNYQLRAMAGAAPKILAAHLKDRSQVWLVTEAQVKRRPYQLSAAGIRDLAGNVVKIPEPIRFNGFALFRVTFSAVPGFAFLDLQGSKRGLPAGEGLYLTGTVLAVARDLKGARLGVAGRTDVTGIPEYEMKPTKQLYKGKPVYGITLLCPPGTYAWKVAHGTAGESKSPPPTLVKVHKSLCTSADGAGVDINPANLTALPLPGSDGKPVSYLDYGAAKLSPRGDEAPGPFLPAAGATLPAPTIMFKRENPDEICVVSGADHSCPGIVVGTWRDIADFVTGGKTDDYDDGLPEVEPTRITPDTAPPALQWLEVRDSESLLVSFDERLQVSAANLKLAAKDALTGAALPVKLEKLGTIGSALLPHQLLLRTGKMQNGASYTLTMEGVADVLDNKRQGALLRTWVAPAAYTPFTPLADKTPPKVIAVLPKSPTGLLVQFDEKILPADGNKSGNFAITTAAGTPPSVLSATTQGGGTAVLLATTLQVQQAAYTLTVSNIADLATPPNVLSSQAISFKGFGDSTPPKVLHAGAISPTQVAVAFDEALSPLAAQAATNYKLGGGLVVLNVAFSGDASRKASAFNSGATFYADNVVLLTTTKQKAGASYQVTPSGVTDLSGNACKTSLSFKGVASTPTVDVVFNYTVSGSKTAAGKVPARAISPAELKAEREGVFMLGTTVSSDGLTKGDPKDQVNVQLGTFPPEGAPLTGAEPQLKDDGQGADAKAGDNVYTIRIKGVPLGTSILYKALASYTVACKSNPGCPGYGQAAFADAVPGPAAFSDGQEFPGNENAVRILGDRNGDGVVRIGNLFGDETTYKKFTNKPPFVWVVDDVKWVP